MRGELVGHAFVLGALFACKKDPPSPAPAADPSANPTGRNSVAVFVGAGPQVCWDIEHPDPEMAKVGADPRAVSIDGSCAKLGKPSLGSCDTASGMYVWHVYDRKAVAR